MATVSINQPSFLPWIGFFRMLRKADVFVFYTDVQFEKQSWQQRAKYPGGYLNVTCEYKLKTLILDVLLKDTGKSTIEKIKKEYGDSAKDVLSMLEDVFSYKKLWRLNVELIHRICAYMDLPHHTEVSHMLNIGGSQTGRLVNICKHFHADTYLSPVGSKEYLDLDQFTQAGIKVEWNIVPDERISGYSIIDSLCKIGPEETRKLCN